MEIVLLLTPTQHHHTVSGAEIQRPENDAASIPARKQNAARLSAPAPVRPQRREQQQVGFVLRQYDAARWQTADCPENSAFFSLVPGPLAKRTALASTYIRVAGGRGGSCGPRISPLCILLRGRAATAHSSSWRSNRIRWDNAPAPLAATGSILPSSGADVPSASRPAGNPDRPFLGTPRSSDEYSDDSSPAFERFPRLSSHDRAPVLPRFAETIAHHASSSIAVPSDIAVRRSITACSPSENSFRDFRRDFTATNRVRHYFWLPA